jgi:predicted DNA-binding antitoxin AbrB/MazE fold protein
MIALRVKWIHHGVPSLRINAMSITIEATYESGTLKLSQPLPLKEQQRVRITIHAPGNPVQESAGLIPCSDAALIERVALDPLEDL